MEKAEEHPHGENVHRRRSPKRTPETLLARVSERLSGKNEQATVLKSVPEGPTERVMLPGKITELSRRKKLRCSEWSD